MFHNVVHIFEKYPDSSFLKKLARADRYDPNDETPLLGRVNGWYQAMDGKEDPHFATELDVNCYPRLWELMLADILQANGLSFDMHAEGPDFSIKIGDQTLWVEAVCPGLGECGYPDSIREESLRNQLGLMSVPVDKIVLRVAGALKAKSERFLQYRSSGLVRPTDICVVAISTAQIDETVNSMCSPPAGLRATVGLGDTYVKYDAKTMAKLEEGIGTRYEIAKTSGAIVPMDAFVVGGMEHIAAVIASDNSPWRNSYDRYASLGLIHNATATVPLPYTVFRDFVQHAPLISKDKGSFVLRQFWFDGENIRNDFGR